MAMNYGGGKSKRKQPGTYHTNKPAGGNFDEGMQSGFGTNKGSRKEGSGLKNDDGGGGGSFVDTYNDKSGGGHGGTLKKPRAGDA